MNVIEYKKRITELLKFCNDAELLAIVLALLIRKQVHHMRPLNPDKLKIGINKAMKDFEDVRSLDFILHFLTVLKPQERAYLEEHAKRMLGF